MILLPAIDIKGGECVRLQQGDYATAHKVAESVTGTAKLFEEVGAKWVHMVDLDGAKAAKPVNTKKVIEVVNSTGLKVEVGGGIRTMETVENYLEQGVSRVILGSSAINEPEFVKQAVQKYGEKIAVGIDAREKKVAAEGWTETSAIDYLELARRMEDIGVKYIIFTDIACDGMLSGPNLVELDRLNNAVSCNIIASGGVSCLKDIVDIMALKLYGAICGKAVYTGDLNLKAALQVCAGEIK